MGRPWPRPYKGTTIAATPGEAAAKWGGAGRIVRAYVWNNLGLATAQPGAAALRWVVIQAPRDRQPLVMVTHLPVSAYAVWWL
jgi:hypothetical protein